MTMIKKDGHWVTVAGGQRMWVGTKAQLSAALAAGELEDGTAVMVTDDYDTSLGHPHPDWANAIRLTVDQLYAGYTASSDGMLVCTGVMTPINSANARIITVNSVPVVKGQFIKTGEFSYGNISCPVSEGDLIKANSSSAWEGETRYFVPWKA